MLLGTLGVTDEEITCTEMDPSVASSEDLLVGVTCISSLEGTGHPPEMNLAGRIPFRYSVGMALPAESSPVVR
jgi:hypothetical protein